VATMCTEEFIWKKKEKKPFFEARK
jgi:hypothetical protein